MPLPRKLRLVWVPPCSAWVRARWISPELLSSHPTEANRVREIEALLPKVMPLYNATQ